MIAAMLPCLSDLRVTETGTATGCRAGGPGWGQGLRRLWEELWAELCSGSDRGKCDSREFQWRVRATRRHACVVDIHGSHGWYRASLGWKIRTSHSTFIPREGGHSRQKTCLHRQCRWFG